MRWGGIALGVAAVVALATGCSDGSGGDHAVSQPKPSTPRAELLLSASDFPAGTKFEVVPPEKSTEPTESGHASISPAACDDRGEPLAGVSDKDASVVMATDDSRGLIYGETILDTTLDLAKVKAHRLGQCGELTIHDGSDETHLKFSEVELPAGLRADQAFEYRSSASSTWGTAEGDKLDAVAVVRGVPVAIMAISMDAKTLDKTVFDKIFIAAVEKVANAK